MKRYSTVHVWRPFTLIEIMIVVVIIAALAAMVAPRLAGRTEQARRKIAEADVNLNISTGLKLYEADNGTFPSTEQGLLALLQVPNSEPKPVNWQGPYLEKTAIDPWNRPYKYVCPGNHNQQGYDLSSFGRDGVEGNEDDVVNWQR